MEPEGLLLTGDSLLISRGLAFLAAFARGVPGDTDLIILIGLEQCVVGAVEAEGRVEHSVFFLLLSGIEVVANDLAGAEKFDGGDEEGTISDLFEHLPGCGEVADLHAVRGG